MKSLPFLLVSLILGMACAQGAAAEKIDCIEPDTLAPRATLDLKRAYSASDGQWVGVFELVNYEIAPGLAISLDHEPDGPVFTENSAVVEFLDMNGIWRELFSGRHPGTYVWDPKQVRLLKPGARIEFRNTLFPRELLSHARTDFRLKLYTQPASLCLLSFPFTAVPAPEQVTGLRAVPHRRSNAVDLP